MKRKIILSILILLFFITGCQKNDVNDKKEVIEYVIFKVDNKVYKANVELENGYILNLPEQPKKDGYIFSYWEQNGKRYDITDKLEANTILNAVFEKVDTKDIVRITLVKNNGDPNEIVEVKKNEKITILNTPKKENYAFLGWYYKDDVFSFDKEITSDITLSAKWGKITTVPANNGKKVVYGDVNEDGVVDEKDSLRLLKYLEELETLTDQGKKNADINNDGKIDKRDSVLFLAYLGHYYENTLPNKPITDYVLYGDVNEDGIISYADLLLLEKYLNNQTKLSNQALKNADINNDKKVNKVDSLQLAKHLANWEGYTTLPNSPITNYVDYGDVNEDGIIDEKDAILLKKYLENNESLTNQGKKNADINKDGKVDKNDYDYLINKVNLKNNLEANNTYGDIDENNKITYADLVLLAKYLEGESNLSEQAKKNADVNKDGKVDSEDLNVLAKYLANWEGYSKLPVTN